MLVLLLSACSGDDGGDDDASDTTEGSTTTTAPPPTSTEADGPDGTVVLADNPDSTLSAVVTVTTDAPATAALVATSADGHQVDLPAGAEPATELELPLVGLRPETEYEVAVEAAGADGTPLDLGAPVPFTTGALPDDFPPITLESVDQERTQPGLTLLSLKPWAPPTGDGAPAPAQGEGQAGGYLAAVDQEGEVVWYHGTEGGVLDARQTDTGYLYTYDELVVREVDALGRITEELAGRVATENPEDLTGQARTTDAAVPVDTDSAHHDAGPLPSGNLLWLSTGLEEVTGPPLCGEDEDEVTYPVIYDVVVEVEPDSGEVVGEWSLADVYDPFERPGTEMCIEGSTFAPPNFFYPVDGVVDWTHGNSVVLDEERNALIVSLRHQSAVLALRYQDDADGPAGELLWELGPEGDLPLDGLAPSYQHAAEVLPDGTILVYDNGNQHPGATAGEEGDDPPFSRAVIYEVDDSSDDPADWTARQIWEHRLEGEGGRPVFTGFLGDVDRLDNDDVLVTHGAISDADGALSARVVEVDRDDAAADGGDVVFDLRVGTPDDPWTVYRSQRIASALPGA
ncbi:aryl-sulfate sulfotransferase [Iamia majanohamensis]|uniref:Aryl-sulfate sulfotransferase n=1 Tax=Iamia majanohamensis TaxID=467976 RepID=A0AAF0BWB8_9ACTN|nr:aryl-sulfate sulfotransferase [Iamia majanohamensis]WCO67645.1 aryl-sulfate sulfotransferase [Iamia majanohamensis]